MDRLAALGVIRFIGRFLFRFVGRVMVLNERPLAVLAALYTLKNPCRVWLGTKREETQLLSRWSECECPPFRPMPLGRESR